mmetsp:Transcript_65795/g.132444  ORF Transcript_65795/g.132444 Transcript_65795/m.132444 type:complete len:206 (-) Transcript_65795:854-1471(-)
MPDVRWLPCACVCVQLNTPGLSPTSAYCDVVTPRPVPKSNCINNHSPLSSLCARRILIIFSAHAASRATSCASFPASSADRAAAASATAPPARFSSFATPTKPPLLASPFPCLMAFTPAMTMFCATLKGVRPREARSGSAPAERSSCATSTSPLTTAQYSAVPLPPASRFTAAPLASSSAEASTCPCSAAHANGLRPYDAQFTKP